MSNSVVDKTLLLVDDEVDLCDILAWDFEDQGLKVIRAYGAWEAIKILESESIDFVLSDVQMKNGSGFDLAKNISESKYSILGLFIMSGQAEFLDINKFTIYGINNVMKKPVDSDVIVDEFKKLLD